jgi:hypothetical protein
MRHAIRGALEIESFALVGDEARELSSRLAVG